MDQTRCNCSQFSLHSRVAHVFSLYLQSHTQHVNDVFFVYFGYCIELIAQSFFFGSVFRWVAVSFRVRFFLEFELLAGIGDGHRRGMSLELVKVISFIRIFPLGFCYHIRLLDFETWYAICFTCALCKSAGNPVLVMAFVHDNCMDKLFLYFLSDFGPCLQGYGVVLINTDEAGTLLVTNFRILFLV